MLKHAEPTTSGTGSIARTITTMYVGLAASLIAGLVVFLDQITADSMTDEIQAAYPDYTASETATEAGAMNTYFYLMLVLGIVGWLWAVWAVRRGARRTHLVGTVIFGLALTAALINLAMPMPDHTLWVNWLPTLVGIVAVIQLWRLHADGAFAVTEAPK